MARERLDDRLATVFGATGFIGRYIVRALARAGWRVRAATRDPEAARFLRPMGVVGQVSPILANIRNHDSVAAAVAGAEVVVLDHHQPGGPMPAAVAGRCLSAARLNKNGANEPMTMFQARGSIIGTSSTALAPPMSTGSVKIDGDSSHQPLTNDQKTAAIDIVQNDTASGEMRAT